jgi:hypothetical protein
MAFMSETEGFKPIESQEELDGIIKDRLKRERESTSKKFEGWISPEDHQRALDEAAKSFDDYKKAHESDEQTIADLTAKNKAYETASLKSRIAREVGLPYECAERIRGEDEQSMLDDAKALKKLVGSSQPIPTKSTETEAPDAETAALRTVLNGINLS